jgi:SAM-dependent methyltransferase
MRVGEAGAGQGYFTFPLARRVGARGLVFANDISTTSLDVIRQRAAREGLGNIKIAVGDVDNPLFPEKNLDMIVMVYVLHELERPVPFVKNLHSYLRPGGPFVIIERNTTVESTQSHSFMTNGRILATMGETGFELDRTETFLPRDTIYIYKAKRADDIHAAAAAGALNQVRTLLEADATQLESKDKDGDTPLTAACKARQVGVADFPLSLPPGISTEGQCAAF